MQAGQSPLDRFAGQPLGTPRHFSAPGLGPLAVFPFWGPGEGGLGDAWGVPGAY